MKTTIAIFGAGLVLCASLRAQVIRTNPGFQTQSVPRNDDGSSDATPLGFTINFFGKLRSTVYVNNNGNLTFDAPLETYTPFGLQKTSREIVAPFFADVDTRGALKGKVVTFGQDTVNGHKAFAANYVDVGYFSRHEDKLNRFQVVLIDRSDTGAGNFTMEFNYEAIHWETGDASGGVNGFGGTAPTVGWSNGTTDAGASFELPGSMVAGMFLNSGARSLVRAHLNTSVVGRLLFQARNGVLSPGLTVQGGPILPDGTVGDDYAFGFTAVGVDGAVKWDAVADVAMPPGLTFANGLLSGRPTVPGTYTFTVSAAATIDGESVTVFERGTLTIGVPKLSIRTACPLPAGTVGQLYSANFLANGPGKLTWSVDDRNFLPPGLTLSSAGLLTGAPTTGGAYNFLVRVAATDSLGTLPVEQNCRVTINPATVRLTNGCALPGATVGVPYAQTLISEGGVGPYRFTLVGVMPLGLSLSSDGRVAGLPLAADLGQFDVQVSDSRSNTIRQSCTVSVADSPMRITSACPLPRATTGTSYSTSLVAVGGFEPYTFSVVGTMPPGLAMVDGGSIAGTPMSEGPYTFRLVATDSVGQQAGMACSLPVRYGQLGIGGCPLPEATAGESYQASLKPTGGSEPFTWTVGGTLPPGLQLTRSGVVTGKVTAPGDYQFAVGLRDNTMLSVSQPCTLKVRSLALRIASLEASGKLGQAYTKQFAAEGGTPPYEYSYTGVMPEGLSGSSRGVVSGTPAKVGMTSFGIVVTDARGATFQLVVPVEIGIPALPAISLVRPAATVPAASADVKIGVALDRAYPLPITGQLVLSLVPQTKNLEANANQVDPHVKFSNGQLVAPFLLAAGSRRVDVAILSTGTVATDFTVSVQGLKVSGVDVMSPISPEIFNVKAVVPVVNSACYVKTDSGTSILVLGSSTTRELLSAEVNGKTTDLTGASSEYFSGDGTIRFGGAFSLMFDADPKLRDVVGPFQVRLGNTVGLSAVVTAQKCQ